jgi:hypothetical protein
LFDGVVDRIGTSSITDGTAVNLFAEDLADDTTIYLASANATDWYRLGSGESSPSAPELPTGGTADQVLAKVDGTNFNVYWKDDADTITPSVVGIPAGGYTGDVLTKTSDADYAVGWSTQKVSRAMIITDVPAATDFNGLDGTGAPGFIGNAAVILELGFSGSTFNYGPAYTEIVDEEETAIASLCINHSQTRITASQSQPVVLTGIERLMTLDDTPTIVFEVFNADLATLPGFVLGATATTSGSDPDMQIPYHAGGDAEFWLDATECT